MLELLVSPIASLLDKVIPDADERNRLANEIATLAERQAHEIAKAQIEVNQQEAAHKSLFVAGWRPFIGWTCGVAMASNFVVAPYVSAFAEIVIPTLDLSEMMPVLGGLLGLGAFRTYEKTKGVAREK
jgi:hypothetical protein